MINHSLPHKLQELQSLISMLHEQLENAPDGSLRLSTKDKHHRYYHYLPATSEHPSATSHYIPKSQVSFANMLAQKDYDKHLYQTANEQLSVIQQFLNHYDPQALETIYRDLHPVRQAMIDPRFTPHDRFIAQWSATEFEGLGFSNSMPEIYSERGERVRSKSVKILADYFYRHDIPYRYEYPITLTGYGIVYPDFTLLNTRTLEEFHWEHLGMMDDPDYCTKALLKVNRYTGCGIIPGKQLILTYESRSCPLNTRVVEQLVQQFLL